MSGAARRPLGHLRILASAGSGKTFRLSGRFIDLVRLGADPATILATTFTRAAAAEIRDRVLRRLALSVLEERARLELASDLFDAPTRDESVALLERVVASLGDLQIRTLDSFFAAVALAAGPLVPLPPEPILLDEFSEGIARGRAVERMLSRDEAEADRLAQTIAALTRGHPTLAPATAIANATGDSRRFWRESEPGAWEWTARTDGLLDETSFAEARERLERAATGLPRSIQRGVATDLESFSSISLGELDGWVGAAGRGTFGAILEGAATFRKTPIPTAIADALVPFVEHARCIAMRELARRTTAAARLAERFDAALRHEQLERGTATFDDLAYALADGASEVDLAEIFFRIDARVSHILLDEFQDTSAVQWRALRPLVIEVMSGDPRERSLFAVGDLKQSIYRWRHASSEILANLGALASDDVPREIPSEELSVSFRSSPEILDAVDRVFSGLDRRGNVRDDDKPAVRAWLGHYRRHRARAGAASGVVELVIAGGETSILQEVVRLVSEIAQEFPSRTIGVLTRTNGAAGEILQALRQRGIAASLRGRGSLRDAAPVNAMLDAIVLADHPDHTIAAFHVGNSPLGSILDVRPDEHRWRERRHAASARIREMLAEHGYAATLDRWRRSLAPHVDARESQRVGELVERALEYDRPVAAPFSLRPAAVARALGAAEVSDPGSGRIAVMNVHQAKGLEFDAVVLTELTTVLRADSDFVAMRPTPGARFSRVARRVAPALLDGVARELVARARASAAEEWLSLLYVALTRARRGLFAVVGAPPSGADESTKYESLIRCAWSSGERSGVVTVCGSRDGWRTGEAAGAGDAGGEEPMARAIRFEAPTGVRPLRALSASRRAGAPARADVSPVLAAARRMRGRLMHAMLERVSWIGESAVDVSSLSSAGSTAEPRAAVELVRDVAVEVSDALTREPFRAVFERPSGRVELLREWAFARLNDEGELEAGRIDRLVLWGEEGARTRASVVDFKSDSNASPDAQLEAYRAAVAARFRIPLDAIETFVAVPSSATVRAVHANASRPACETSG